MIFILFFHFYLKKSIRNVFQEACFDKEKTIRTKLHHYFVNSALVRLS